MSNSSINNASVGGQGETSGQTGRSSQTEATKSEQKSSPSSSFIGSALDQYCRELESLRNSFQQVMALFGMLLINTDKRMMKFIDDYGKNKVEDSSTVKFNLDGDKRSDFDRLKKEMNSVQSATQLMPRNFIVALISCYDSFFGKILRYIFMVRPQILDSSDRTLKYSDLLEFADIPAAREYLVEKEVESVIRKSHVEHFAWLEKKLKTSLKKSPQLAGFYGTNRTSESLCSYGWSCLIPVLQAYKQHKCDMDSNIRTGTSLGVSREYFENAYGCFYEIGFKLAHVIWRKLQKEEIGEIDSNLIKQSYDLIAGGHYEIADRILEFFTQSDILHEKDSKVRIMTINLAQSYKWRKNASKTKEVLSRYDWSASEEQFKLAVMVLQDKWDEVYRIMHRLKHNNNFRNHITKTGRCLKSFARNRISWKFTKNVIERLFTLRKKFSNKKGKPPTPQLLARQNPLNPLRALSFFASGEWRVRLAEDF